jgi:hypothetical protein
MVSKAFVYIRRKLAFWARLFHHSVGDTMVAQRQLYQIEDELEVPRELHRDGKGT